MQAQLTGSCGMQDQFGDRKTSPAIYCEWSGLGSYAELTHSILVSIKTFFLVPVRQCIEADRILCRNQMKADNNRSDGSSRKTFMTTPVTLNSVTRENMGGWGELSPDGPSKNDSCIGMNSMTRSSSYLSKTGDE